MFFHGCSSEFSHFRSPVRPGFDSICLCINLEFCAGALPANFFCMSSCPSTKFFKVLPPFSPPSIHKHTLLVVLRESDVPSMYCMALYSPPLTSTSLPSFPLPSSCVSLDFPSLLDDALSLSRKKIARFFFPPLLVRQSPPPFLCLAPLEGPIVHIQVVVLSPHLKRIEAVRALGPVL